MEGRGSAGKILHEILHDILHDILHYCVDEAVMFGYVEIPLRRF